MPQDNMESVWDYPRPPRLERTTRRLRVVHAGVTIADTVRGWRVLETSHPPVYYIPPDDIRTDLLLRSPRRESFCEYKGMASYWSLAIPGQSVVEDVAWSYADPSHNFQNLKGCLAFYASRVDESYVDDERVTPQPGHFYGGWITSDIQGPFKGGPGTLGW